MLILSLLLLVSAVSTSPVVQTPYGPVEGFEYALSDGETANVFLGIPFAKPPVGELRFELPQKPQKWTEVKETKEFLPSCVQHHRRASALPDEVFAEDCLSLNVMAPAKKSAQPNGYPVMVFIHGGGFEYGSSNFYGYRNISENFVREGIVFVTLNYRLSALGFFSTGDDVVPGNLGFWDQTLALQFVKEGISKFGGDPERITISGESAGGASVSALTFSPHSNKLFQQALTISGSIYGTWATYEGVVEESFKLSKAMGCSGSSAEQIACLKTKSVDDFLDGIETIEPARDNAYAMKFNPRIDGVFFPQPLDVLLKKAPKIPLVTGITDMEGGFMSMFAHLDHLTRTGVPADKWATYCAQDIKDYINEKVITGYGSEADELKQKMIDHYVNRPREDGKALTATNYLERLTEMFGDIYFNVAPVQEAHDKIALDVPVYLFIEEYHNPVNVEGLPVKGAYHGYEIPYLFGRAFGPMFDFNDEDWVFKKNLLEGFVTFVKTGKPTIDGSTWKQATEDHPRRYMSLAPTCQMKDGYRAETLDFWMEDVANHVDLQLLKNTLFPGAKKSGPKRTEL